MKTVDVNCFLGHWPFRKIRRGTFADLKAVHAENQIAFGYVSSLDSIFYHDPFEGDIELHEIIKGSDYQHILSVNPTLPCCLEDVRRGVQCFDIKGVRIYPDIHGFDINGPETDALCRLLGRLGLPLVLTVRLEDERMCYLLQSRPPKMEALDLFLKTHPQNAVLLTGIYYSEILQIKDTINSLEHVFFDASGLKESLFVVEKLLTAVPAEKLLYGSQHSLYCLKSTLLLLEKAAIDPAVRDQILAENYRRLFK